MPGTILIIDDDPLIRFVLAELLTDERYQAIVAADGHEALAYLHTADELPDLILLDLGMPRLDGWQFREVQREDPRLAGIPVVLLSAAHELGNSAATLKVPEYLAKPIRAAHLLDVVERYCVQARGC